MNGRPNDSKRQKKNPVIRLRQQKKEEKMSKNNDTAGDDRTFFLSLSLSAVCVCLTAIFSPFDYYIVLSSYFFVCSFHNIKSFRPTLDVVGVWRRVGSIRPDLDLSLSLSRSVQLTHTYKDSSSSRAERGNYHIYLFLLYILSSPAV